MRLRHVLPVLLALGVGLSCLADPADARRGGRGGGRAGGGQKKGNLTEEQRQARKEKRAERQETLTDEERAAMKEQRQQRTGDRFAELNLTDDQKAKLQTVRDKYSTRTQELRDSGERPSADEMKTIREQQQAEIAGILTAEQRAQLEERRAQRPEGGRGRGFGRRGEKVAGTAQTE